MSSLQYPKYASPNARLGELSINGKSLELPSHFVTLTKSTDVEKLLEAIQHLESIGEDPPLPNTGGIVVELQTADEILSNQNDRFHESQRQSTLEGDEARVNLYSAINDLSKVLITDPNTDRIFYSNYREEFGEFADNMAQGLGDIIERYADEENDEINSQVKGYRELRRTVRPSEFCEYVLNMQSQMDSDIYLSPYYPVEQASIGGGNGNDIWNKEDRREQEREKIPENIRLYKISKDIAKRRYDREVFPVISLKTDILKADTENGDDGMEPPQIWRDIMEAYSGLDCGLYFLKITNADMDPGMLDKEVSEGIVSFVKLLRKEYIDAPVFFLGMDELAYILMAHGLDIYTHPIYDQPFESGNFYSEDVRPDPKEINHNRKFIVPRNRERKKFDQLNSLGCFCPFCQPFVNTDPAEISIGKQGDLRKKHWLWLRDEEMDQMKEAIENDQVRPALMDFYTDSDWEKNYIKFL